jgi:hypothetical protein
MKLLDKFVCNIKRLKINFWTHLNPHASWKLNLFLKASLIMYYTPKQPVALDLFNSTWEANRCNSTLLIVIALHRKNTTTPLCSQHDDSSPALYVGNIQLEVRNRHEYNRRTHTAENSSNFELINILSNVRLEPFTWTEAVKHLFYRLTNQVKPEYKSAVSEMLSRTVIGQLPKRWTSIPKWQV